MQTLLIDDKKVRDVAEEHNINYIGTLAILIKAKHNKLLPLLQPVFQALLGKKRFYQKELLNKILTVEKEELL
jgi:predicted nucleic acid-binding protein